jgi:prepilin-type N-terminal cleavage/methylation domain-containing protein
MREVIINEAPTLRAGANRWLIRRRQSNSLAGYSLVELLLVVAISLILAGVAIPATRSAIASYQLSAAVDSATGAIQGARYQAIMHGYQYQVALSAAQNTSQVLSEAPPAAAFTATGPAVQLSAVPITLSAATTFQFKPNGSVSAPVGAMNFTISYNGTTKTVTVSNYGSISVQ